MASGQGINLHYVVVYHGRLHDEDTWLEAEVLNFLYYVVYHVRLNVEDTWPGYTML